MLFTSDVPHYFRELSPIYFLTNSRAEFRTVTDFWAGPSGVIWSESYSEIEYVCEDICAILDKLGEGNLSNDVRKRMNFKLLGYSGHKDYSMNDLLAWYISLPLSKDKLLTYGMQLLKVSDMAHSTGDNRLAGSVDSEIFDVSMLLGPKYLDALFELKNTVETFYNWRECILDTLYKKLPDASIADDDIMCIHKIVNAWINPQYEQRRQYSNKIEYLCEFNYKIAESISDTALKDEVLASDNCAHTDKTPEYHIPEEDSLDTYGQILELIQNNEYSFDVEKKICEVLLEDTSKSTSKRIRFLETAGSFIKEEYKASFVSKCVVPFITTNNEYGLRTSGFISLIEKYYHLVSQDDWLKLFCSCMPKEFSVNERSFYYTNDDIEAINLYYNKGYHPDKIEILFSQRIEMHLHWITAGGLIDCPQYSLCIDESISSLNDFVQKHLGV